MVVTKGPVKRALHEELGLAEGDVRAMYRFMRLSRALCERMWLLQRSGKTSFVITNEGHEAAQVGSAYALDSRTDFYLPYYRGLAVALVAGMSPREVLLGVLARAADPSSGGRQLPGHYFHPKLRIVSGSSPVATQIPHAAGIALAAKMRGEPSVAAVYFGDGAASKGDFHEGLNFAGVHRLPVVFVCENNGYAISVPRHKQAAVESIAVRAQGYGFPGVSVDGNDVLAVYRAMREAVQRARKGEGPTLIEARTYRLSPHTSNDDDTRYRSREEVQEWRRRDPIERFRRYLLEWELLDRETDEAMGKEIAATVDDATAFAEASPYPAPETALEHVYGKGV